MRTILGLIGAPNSGKDIVANFLIKTRGFQKIAFADKIKERYYEETGYTEEQFKSVRGTPLEQKIRQGLWEYSDEKRNLYGNMFFITPVIENILQSKSSIVITDVRTIEEFYELQKIHSNFIKIRRRMAEIKDEKIIGTRIPIEMCARFESFWNCFDDLKITYLHLDAFCKKTLKL